MHATNCRVRRLAASICTLRYTQREDVVNADKGRPARAAVSIATSATSVGRVWNAMPPLAFSASPCSRVNSLMSGMNLASGGKMPGTCSTSEARCGL
eukprot:5396752-Pleurochrysis_carterae.AAC.4